RCGACARHRRPFQPSGERANAGALMDMSRQIAKRPPDHLFKRVTDAWTRPFWEAASRHRVAAPRCGEGGTFRMPPTPFFPRCRSPRVEWIELSGEGRLYSYSIVCRATFAEMESSIPYVTAVVELPDAQGIRLITNIVDTPLDRIRIGANVTVVFDDIGDGVTIPRFRL